MELRQIEYFCMVGKLQSFTRAAEHLHIAQPSITQAIQKLEQELNVQLFDRKKKKTVLTADGQVFLARMESILQELQLAVEELQDLRALRKGTINIGVPPMLMSSLFPDVFAGFKEAYPNLQLLATEESSSLEAADKVEKEELAAAIVILSEQSRKLECLVVAQEELVLCLQPGHPLSQQKAVSFEDLKEEKFILLKQGSYQHQSVVQHCRDNNFVPNTIFSSNQIKTIKAMIAKGTGISLLMRMVVQDDPQITVVPLQQPIHFNIGLVWKKDRHLSTAEQTFIRFLQQRYDVAVG